MPRIIYSSASPPYTPPGVPRIIYSSASPPYTPPGVPRRISTRQAALVQEITFQTFTLSMPSCIIEERREASSPPARTPTKERAAEKSSSLVRRTSLSSKSQMSETISCINASAQRILNHRTRASSFLVPQERIEPIGRLVPHVSTSKAKRALIRFTKRVIAGTKIATPNPCQCLAAAKASILEKLGVFSPLIEEPKDDVTANGIVHDLAGHTACTACPTSRVLARDRAERVIAYLGEPAGKEWVDLAERTRRLRDERDQETAPKGYTPIPFILRDIDGSPIQVEAFHTPHPHLMHTITPQAMGQWVLPSCNTLKDDFKQFFSCNHKLCISVADPNADKPLLYGIEDRIAFLIHLDPSGIITTGVCDQLSPVGRVMDSFSAQLGEMQEKIESDVRKKITAVSEKRIAGMLKEFEKELSPEKGKGMLKEKETELRREGKPALEIAIHEETAKQLAKRKEDMQAYMDRMPTIVNYKKFMAEITAIQSSTRYYIRKTIEDIKSSSDLLPMLQKKLATFEESEAAAISDYMRDPLSNDGYKIFLKQLETFKEIYQIYTSEDEDSVALNALTNLITECQEINEIIDAHAADIVLLHARDRGEMSAYFVDKTPEQLRQLARAMIPPAILSPSQLHAGVKALPENTAAEIAIKHTEVDVWSRQCSFGGVYIPRRYLLYDTNSAALRVNLPEEKQKELIEVFRQAARLGLPILIPQPPAVSASA